MFKNPLLTAACTVFFCLREHFFCSWQCCNEFSLHAILQHPVAVHETDWHSFGRHEMATFIERMRRGSGKTGADCSHRGTSHGSQL